MFNVLVQLFILVSSLCPGISMAEGIALSVVAYPSNLFHSSSKLRMGS